MLTGGDKTLVVNTLAIAATNAKLNMNDNDVIVDYTGASVEARPRAREGRPRRRRDERDLLHAGLARRRQVMAIADNADWGKTSFNGIAIDRTAIGKYTFFGDANLDGKVTGDDYVSVDANLGTGDAWLEGDFNMNGLTTGDDYVAIDANLGKGTSNPLAYAELKAEMVALHAMMFGQGYVEKLAEVEADGFGATRPRAGGLTSLGLGAAGLLGRRRRRDRASLRHPLRLPEPAETSCTNHRNTVRRARLRGPSRGG